MFRRMLEWVRATLLHFFGQSKTDLTISPKMENLIALWSRMYEGCDTKGDCSLGLPAFISGEFARLVTLESKITLSGRRGEWMDKQLLTFRQQLRANVEYACAIGGCVFKPYVSGDGLNIDVVQGDCFFPTAFDSTGRLTGAVFTQQIIRDGKIYTRLESHEFLSGKENIQNKAFMSSSNAALGGEVPLTVVPDWADIAPNAEITGIDRPLFAYFRIPLANNKDRFSPLGVSVFANAVHTIPQADEQYGRLLWEYEGGQLAIDVDESAIRTRSDGSVKLDQREQRLYRRALNIGGNLYEAFAPALRDASYRAGLNEVFRKIEVQCNLAFGTISDPQTVEKTATEVRTGKQRSYAAVCDIQKSLQMALDDLFYAMDRLAQLYDLGPAGEWEAAYEWHDSVLQDEETVRLIDREDALSGFIPKWKYNADWRGMTDDEAKAAVQEAVNGTSLQTNTLTFGKGDA